MNVRVTNRNNMWVVKDKYAGINYEFQPNVPVLIPQEAAEHIFGFGLSEKERLKKMMRMGIANMKDGKKLWDNILMKATGVEPTGAVREAA